MEDTEDIEDMEQKGAEVGGCYALVATAIGDIGLGWSAVGLRVLQLPEADRRATERRLAGTLAMHGEGGVRPADPPPPILRAIASLRQYCRGVEVDFAAVPLDLAGLPTFRQRVYAAARAVAWGRTVSYGELARRIGQHGAARAVGQALGLNPLPIIIPCHRILASGGRIGGFSAYGGAATKLRLLELEGLSGAMPLLPGLADARR
jgi:methylated-DNA-[protein]-cysteine S-methyltransferase